MPKPKTPPQDVPIDVKDKAPEVSTVPPKAPEPVAAADDVSSSVAPDSTQSPDKQPPPSPSAQTADKPDDAEVPSAHK